MFSKRPFSLVVFLVALHTLTMIATALCVAFGATSWVEALVYQSTAVAQGQLWRLVTYAFVASPTIWFVLEMMMLYYFGRAVEKELGTRVFGVFYGGLLLLSSLSLQLLSCFGRAHQMSGDQGINAAVFAAFVAIYPDIPFLFALSARWTLLALLAITSLQLLEKNQFTAITLFLSQSLAALLFMKRRGYSRFFSAAAEHPTTDFFKKLFQPSSPTKTGSKSSTLLGSASISTSVVTVTPKKAVLKKKKSTPLKKATDIDALLEKISQTGMASLTEIEKKELENARAALLRRDAMTNSLSSRF